MTTLERRLKILNYLNLTRYAQAEDLANKFEVTISTIYRDIDYLSIDYPIYTRTGKSGGIYVMDGYKLNKEYLSKNEAEAIKKLLQVKELRGFRDVFHSILEKYESPRYMEEER